MKVLIAVDSSPFANQILDAVRKRLWSEDTSFRIVTVVEKCADWVTQQEYTHQSQIILEQRVDYLRHKLPHQKVSSELLEGPAGSQIAEAAADWHADLIVIGSHGDTGIRKSHVGSVAADVVNKAPCAVEVTKVRRVHTEPESSVAGTNRTQK